MSWGFIKSFFGEEMFRNNQSEISIVLCQPIRGDHLKIFLYLLVWGQDSWVCRRERWLQWLCYHHSPPPDDEPRPWQSSPSQRTATRPADTCAHPRTTRYDACWPPWEICPGWSRFSQPRDLSHQTLHKYQQVCPEHSEINQNQNILVMKMMHLLINYWKSRNSLVDELVKSLNDGSLLVSNLDSKICSNVQIQDWLLEELCLWHVKNLDD